MSHQYADPTEPPDDYDPTPAEIECYLCSSNPMATTGHPVRQVVEVLPPRPGAADPTEAYRLECGHVVI